MTFDDNLAALKKVDRPILVTGGGGFLGRAIVRRLLQLGLSVRSFSRRRHAELTLLDVEQIRGDLADPEAVLKAVGGGEIVIHTAAKPPPWGRYRDYFRTNTVGTETLVQACQRRGIAALVHTSSPSVVFDGGDLEGVDESVPYPSRYLSPYAQTKALAEQCVLVAARAGLTAIVLRPHEIWGPEDPHIVPRIIAKAKRLKRIGDGKNLVDTVYVDNAAEAHLLAAGALLQKPHLSGRTYFISQDDPVPFWDIVDEVLKAADMDPIKGTVPYPAAWLAGAICEGIWRCFNLAGEPPLTRFLANAAAKSHWFDIRAAKRDLGYRPRISTAEGLKRLADWLRSTQSKEETE
jgi:nucleoside-diphosphate-sugar epimerase